MDPVTVVSLVGAMANAGLAITKFTNSCMDAKSDLAAVQKELDDLEKVLKLLQAEIADRNIPNSLKGGIRSSISSMSSVVDQIEQLLESNSGKIGAVKWTMSGKTQAAALRSQLAAYRDSLSLTLEMMSLSLSKSVKSDTTAIKTQVTEIQAVTNQIPMLIEEGLRRGYPGPGLQPAPPVIIAAQTVSTSVVTAPVTLASNGALITTNEKNVCGVFCHSCKNGIPYLSDLIICLDCDTWLCARCQLKHKAQHMHRVRLQLNQIAKGAAVTIPAKSCMHCLSRVTARWECEADGCRYALCFDCSWYRPRRKKFFGDHEKEYPGSDHKTYQGIYSPFWFVTRSWKHKNCPCYSAPHKYLEHCDRCHAPWGPGQNIFGCQQCRQKFGRAQTICEDCFRSPDEQNTLHKIENHTPYEQHILFTPSIPDSQAETKDYFYCVTCKIWLKYGDQYDHEHPVQYHHGPRLFDTSVYRNYQICDPGRVSELSNRYPGPAHDYWKCCLCFFGLAYDHPSLMCLAGGCIYIHFCASCTSAVPKRATHRHPLHTVMVRKTLQLPAGASMPECGNCRKAQTPRTFKGLFCTSCTCFSICITCLNNLRHPERSPQINGLITAMNHRNPRTPGFICNAAWVMYTL